MKYGLGARRSHPDKLARAKLAHEHPDVSVKLLTAGAIPEAYDLAQWQPPIMDQDGVGACTWHSLPAAIFTSLNKAGEPLAYIPSPRLGYAATRAFERAATVGASQDLPQLTDSGAELADAINVAATDGVAPMQGPTSDGRNSDVGPDNVNNEPDLVALEQAATKCVTGAYRVDPGASNVSDQLAAAIASGYPIYAGFFCDTAFQELGPNDVAQAPDQNDPQGGGHAVYLTGFQPVSATERKFRLTNSWGNWCDNGKCWVSEAWVKAAWEFWVVQVKVVQS